MKANEVRVGNWVTDEFWDTFKTHIQVDSIDSKGINPNIEDDGRYPECADRWIEPQYAFEKLNGIPLSPEILEKCGFEYLPEVLSWSDSHHYIYKSNDGFKLSIFCSLDEDCKILIKHLHQLQNLYYALVGDELNYQP